MDLEKVKEAQVKAVADAIAGGMSEELAKSIFGSMLTTVETEAAKDAAKLKDFDTVVKQRDEAKEKARLGEDAAAKLKAIEDGGKSETERLTGEVTALSEQVVGLSPYKEQAEAYEGIVTGILEATVKGLPEAMQTKFVTISDGMSIDKKLAFAESLKDVAAIPGAGPGSQLPGGSGGKTITRAEYDALGKNGDLTAWDETRKKVVSKEITVID